MKKNDQAGQVKRFNEEKSLIEKVFETISFEVDLCIQMMNMKNINHNIKNIKYDQSEVKDFTINSDFYSNLPNSQSGNKKDKLQEDSSSLFIIVELAIHKDFNSLQNKEREKLGFIGIINEAATCYMNSMLQTLNVFGSFKKAVFQIPTNDEDYNSVALSLQRLFYDLMKDSSPISTNRLIKSFGWGREQIHIQHDVQEFNLLLSDVMEKKMKGTPVEGTFSKLFEGKIINYIKCVNVNYKSEKEEKFNDIQLTVKGCKNIYESLNVYTEEELLDGEDKYDAGSHGKQKAKKGIRFQTFPPILILQLKRFEYNPKKEAMVKNK